MHLWEPELTVEVWDFGLSDEALADIATWDRVELRHLPLERLPPHLGVNGTGAYAAKPWVTLDALER